MLMRYVQMNAANLPVEEDKGRSYKNRTSGTVAGIKSVTIESAGINESLIRV
jgi:hypothetical protein